MSKPNITALGRDGALSCRAKSCTGSGMRTLREWFAGSDAVILFGGAWGGAGGSCELGGLEPHGANDDNAQGRPMAYSRRARRP